MQITIDTNKLQSVGENIQVMEQDSKLILVLDITKTIGMSSTGKMMGIGSTGGFQALPGGLKGNIYIGQTRKG